MNMDEYFVLFREYMLVQKPSSVNTRDSYLREFWQRAEERTQNTARLYDELGMAEYQAIEVFVRLF